MPAAAAHPRRCGDHPTLFRCRARSVGSSPQVRGPLIPPIAVLTLQRLIPAGAGTTSALCNPQIQRRAHPRRCGDHGGCFYCYRGAGGSSPQVRGPQVYAPGHRRPDGLIPAGAGTTREVDATCTFHRAHPRRCGDHKDVWSLLITIQGSSPQVRGPPPTLAVVFSTLGLIPAGAGTTQIVSWKKSKPWAHPRRCGDHPQPRRPSR